MGLGGCDVSSRSKEGLFSFVRFHVEHLALEFIADTPQTVDRVPQAQTDVKELSMCGLHVAYRHKRQSKGQHCG